MAETREYTVCMVGHGHIDPTWLWRWTEGYEEVRATFRSALERMKETPSFVFTASSACFYAWIKACDPEMFEEIRARVQEGRWDIAGGWWVEPDCNIPGGEAFVRQGLYSQRFFQEEFGVRAKVGFNPDSFGHAGTLPQIFAKQGIDYYVYMRPSPDIEMDYPGGTTFYWEAKDGSRVLASNILITYVAEGDEVTERIRALVRSPHLNPNQKHVMGFYGVGNHGGGPTKRAIAAIIDAQKDDAMPEVKFASLHDYFMGFLNAAEKEDIPTISTDLQHHARGCYSAHSEVKRLSRRAEHALMTAERFATAAWLLQDHPYPAERIENAWKGTLYNQFHDILAGTSIESSYEDTRNQMGAAIHTAQEVFNESLQTIARHVDTSAEGNTIMVVNPLPWPVKQVVKASDHAARYLERGISTHGARPDERPIHLVDERGKLVPCQHVLGERINHTDHVFCADVPALGYRCYHMRSGVKSTKAPGMLEGDRHALENNWWRIEFDPYEGHICRLYDKKNKVEVLEKGNVLAALVDSSDTWSHGYDEWRQEAGRFRNAKLHLLECGDVRATVWIQSRFNHSTIDQFVTLYRETDTIDCVFRINWQERYTMLKLGYETSIVSGQATYDAPYGCQERNTEGFEEPGQQWLDLTGSVGNTPYGFAVLNDSKYGFDVLDGSIRITMLRSPAYAHHDRARHDASTPYAIMDQGWQTVKIRLVPHAGAWHEAGVVRKAWELNEPMITHIESAHAGALPPKASFLECEADNVALTVLKRSEDGEELVIRGYETAGKECKTRIALPHRKQSFEVVFKPHEIKTLRVDKTTWTAKDVNLLEE